MGDNPIVSNDASVVPVPQSAAGALSPDGHYRWDGTRWTPVAAMAVAVTPGALVVSPKSPGVSTIASVFLPGLGTIINGEGTKGALMLAGYFVLWVAFWFTIWFLVGLIFVPFILGLWIWGMIDAYQGARNWNAAHGIVS